MIIGRVKNQTLEIEQPVIVADTIDYLTSLFTFSPDWNGLTKWAHFAKGETVYDIELVNDGIAKDRHLSLSAGAWSVYLHGNEIIGGAVTERITTQVKSLTVEASGVLNGEPLPVAPSSVGEQILAIAQDAKDTADAVEAAANAGDFDGVPAGFGDPVISAETLTPGSPATASIVASGPDTAKIFTIALGIPEGDKGDAGDAAGFGTPTATANTLSPGASATAAVSASGDATAKVFAFTFGIPSGLQGIQGERGYSGLVPAVSVAYAADVEVAANTFTTIGSLTGAINITLGTGVENYSNEWDFVLVEGATAYNVVLPTVSWGLGSAPSFAANTTTVIRLYYIGATLCGEWSVVA